MRSQQRTSGIRRIGQNPFAVQYATIDWFPILLAGNNITYDLYAPGNILLTDLDGCTLNGLPQINGSTPANPVVAAAIVGNQLRLTYTNAPILGDQFFVLPNDQAFRGKFGEYLCSKEFLTVPLPPPVIQSQASGAAIAGSGVDITLTGAGGQLFYNGVPPIVEDTLLGAAVSVTVVGNIIHAEFSSPVVAGMSVSWVDVAGWFLNSTFGDLDGFVFGL